MSTLAPSSPRVLIADDQTDLLEALRLLLKSEGYDIETVTSPAAVLTALAERPFDAVLLDLNYARDTTSGAEGLDLVSRVRALDNTLPVVALTAWGSIELAVDALHRGAHEFIQKPWDNAQLVAVLRAEIARGRARREARRMHVERARVEQRERDEARAVQRRLLPDHLPQLATCELVAGWHPAAGIGGDYFDALSFGDQLLGLCIGDVVGKGMPAALLMSNLQAAFKAFAAPAIEPRDLCATLNQFVCRNIGEGKFITFFYAVLDGERRQLAYCNAGHLPPALVRAEGSCQRLQEGGAVLGIFPDWTYEQGTCALEPGDRLVLFTDGLTEACNAAGEEFGDERLVKVIADHRHQTAADMHRLTFAQVRRFCSEFQDDATLIVGAVENGGIRHFSQSWEK